MQEKAAEETSRWTQDVLIAGLKQIFRPSAPIEDQQMFKGRARELTQVQSAIQSPGQHCVIYGERGVGKTSLAQIAKSVFLASLGGPANGLAVRVPCTYDDNFASVWKNLPPRLMMELDSVDDPIFRDRMTDQVDWVEDKVALDDANPDAVTRSLTFLGNQIPLLVVLDEFDRIRDAESRRMFADLVKMLSDDLTKATLVIVGVADDVQQLIVDHRSTERAVREVHVPRMSHDDLRRLTIDGFALFSERTEYEITLEPNLIDAISRMSEGFPHYAHLLSESIGEFAIRNDLHNVAFEAIGAALEQALENANQTIRASYVEAVQAARTDATYADTLLACAMAKVDELGFFAAPALQVPLTQISHRDRKTASFTQHLRRFSDGDHPILDSKGSGRGMRYRFSNPLMRPFVLIKGIREKRIVVGEIP